MKFILICFILFACQNNNDKYYSIEETNSRIAISFSLKDSECKTYHPLNNFIPGDGNKSQVDYCVQAILIKTCVDWSITDPTPNVCRIINFRVNYKTILSTRRRGISR